jgi:hypothetical protein
MLTGTLPKPDTCMKTQMDTMARDWTKAKLFPATCNVQIKPPNSPGVLKVDPAVATREESISGTAEHVDEDECEDLARELLSNF